MNTTYYRSFDQLRSNELTVIRHGWWNAGYELTDGQFSYGTISFRYLSRRFGTVETANGSWIFEKPAFSRVLTIRKPNGELIGKVNREFLDRLNILALSNGFNAEFRRTGFFPTEFTWSTTQHGEILRSIRHHFSFNQPFTLTLNPTIRIPEVPLLAFLSIQILLLRQRRKAAAH